MSDLEKKRKATYDIKILGWILGFVGKYQIYFALSFLLMTATAALEITVPYLIKTAVDNQIYPTWSKTESGQQPDQTLLGLGEEATLCSSRRRASGRFLKTLLFRKRQNRTLGRFVLADKIHRG